MRRNLSVTLLVPLLLATAALGPASSRPAAAGRAKPAASALVGTVSSVAIPLEQLKPGTKVTVTAVPSERQTLATEIRIAAPGRVAGLQSVQSRARWRTLTAAPTGW